ncbi:MAG TPA: lysophospholipid acyltransferase family protein [Hyphomicrobium zavarzinii]|jgi:1-acyl-sn-glycerol-3-phosphate acyltransferase|uniref:lysophospholipid acyltransferase family protein n=1 Tax=Hyphomicrobium sp. DMF-1 TaxID=3019544 RepID=UPI0022EBFE70|nr:lysophospholipid acyltransferase family protein [Hyphomicrobium sp. DMF-1]WBT38832.1 lysophospholipid acyltransferase family protein [Hyphomicrobium sp. DMF-1]HML42407.1 lysophospholipid acyltransferase family protein [Hyphomicrobium zavarzinii]
MLLLRSYLFALAFYVTTALFLVLGSWLLLGPRRWAMAGLKLHAIVSVWLLRVIAGTRLEVRGREKLPKGAYLVVSKHQSAWDTFGLVPLFRDPAIVLKDELKWIPFYGWFCVKFEHILVKRDKAAKALKQMISDAQSRAAEGREIVIFPEGTRQAPGAPPDYKPGYVALYEALELPCVPLALNSGLFWPRRQLVRHPGTIVVEFLDPIPAGLPRKEFRAMLEARLEAASQRLVEEGKKSLDENK